VKEATQFVLVALSCLVACTSTPSVPPQCACESGEERAVCVHAAAGNLRVHAAKLRREGFPAEAARLSILASKLDADMMASVATESGARR